MKKGKITITGSRVVIEPGPDGQVWLSRWQMADLFGVYTAKITSNIKAIIRSGGVKPDLKGSIEFCGKIVLPELYGLEMIIALAFRIDSAAASTFRKWIIRSATSNDNTVCPNIFINCGSTGIMN